MKRAIIILSAFILAFSFSITGFAKDNNNGGSINLEGNGSIDDSHFTNATGEKGGTVSFGGNGNIDDCHFTNNTGGNGGTDY